MKGPCRLDSKRVRLAVLKPIKRDMPVNYFYSTLKPFWALILHLHQASLLCQPGLYVSGNGALKHEMQQHQREGGGSTGTKCAVNVLLQNPRSYSWGVGAKHRHTVFPCEWSRSPWGWCCSSKICLISLSPLCALLLYSALLFYFHFMFSSMFFSRVLFFLLLELSGAAVVEYRLYPQPLTFFTMLVTFLWSTVHRNIESTICVLYET